MKAVLKNEKKLPKIMRFFHWPRTFRTTPIHMYIHTHYTYKNFHFSWFCFKEKVTGLVPWTVGCHRISTLFLFMYINDTEKSDSKLMTNLFIDHNPYFDE